MQGDVETTDEAARDSGLARWVLFGALGWAVYAVLHVALSPLVIDETALSAQILTGAVDYPDGHPHEVFHLQAFSLPNHLSAAILAGGGSLELVSLLRNVLVVFLSGFAPFLVALGLTRRPLVGFAAGALVLTDCVYRFQGVYPTFLFPTFYSHGHVGMYAALATVALLSMGFTRTGGLLVGLMPGIHPLLGALVWGWCAVAFLMTRAMGHAGARARPRRGFLVLAALGFVVSAGSWAFAQSLAPEVVTEGAYAVGEGGELVRSQFIEFTDPHRRMPPADSSVFLFGYLANSVLFALFALLLLRFRATSSADADATRGVLAFGAIAWAAVWGSRGIELALGELPGALLTAMPYRLSNISAILLVPLGVAALVRVAGARGRTGLTAAALLLAGLLVVGGAAAADELLRPEAYRKAFRLAASIGLFGSVVAAGLVARKSRLAQTASLAALAVLAWVFLVQRAKSGFQGLELLGAALVGGVVVLLVAGRRDDDDGEGERLPLAPLVALGVLVCAAGTLRSSHAEESSLVSAFDEDVALWLEENTERDELVVGPLIPRTQLQVKTRRPVLLELGTLWLMPYLPEVSSVIGRLTRDVYGVDYSDRDRLLALAPEGFLGQHGEAWKDAWRGRSRARWIELGETWDFRVVVAPTSWELPLEPRVVSVEWTLYTIPGP